ncbi:hypothetical protein ULMS_07760 [Patiriisocius marinistellae]|uniref:Uncharacterized protein n=1 Tax=Patiriisocius marinistellae TaxID=2494560 RepID=A0A5J4FVJ3_9FLAO|nr:DUF6252 family protein [Patiriisocius marinistellae]GEQ85268.1 hypothetical protein ULMS_07760 [Patiriisocius marinistellae]
MNISIKKFVKIIMISMSLCLLVTSCSKSDEGVAAEEPMNQDGNGDANGGNGDGGNPIDLSGNFSVLINNNAFVPTEIIAVKSANEESMSIEVRDDTNFIRLIIQEDLSVGTHVFGETVVTSVVIDGFPEFSNINPTGTLTITAHDLTNNILVGTFSFTVESVYHNSTITLTDGEFNFVYIQGT